MIEVCLYHFDGSNKDLIKFCLKAIKEGMFKGSIIAKGVKKVINFFNLASFIFMSLITYDLPSLHLT